MSLISRDFGEYYDELRSYQPTFIDQQKSLMRDEVAGRRKIEVQNTSDFADVLHVAGVMIGEKKKRERSSGADRNALTINDKQNAVWFPALQKRQVAPPTRRLTVGNGAFPHAKYRELCEEEAELRRWVHGVEKRLRANVEGACAESWFVIMRFEELRALEARGRTRVGKDQLEGFTSIRKSVFQVAPPDLFRRMVVERYGTTVRESNTPKNLTVEELEEKRRDELVVAELQGRAEAFQYLHDAYDTYLFMEHHQEICNRLAIMEEETCDIFSVFAQCSRDTFGMIYYFTPTISLHCASGRSPHLALLAEVHSSEMRRRAERVRHTFAEARLAYAEGGIIAWEEERMIQRRKKEAEAAEKRAAEARAEAEAAVGAAALQGAAEAAAASHTPGAADGATSSSTVKQTQSVCFVELDEKRDFSEKQISPSGNYVAAAGSNVRRAAPFKAFESASSEEDAEQQPAY